MASSLQRAYAQSLIFGEETSEELSEWKQELLDEILDLKDERDRLSKEAGLPLDVERLQSEVLVLKKKKSGLKGDIERLELEKLKDIEIKLEKEIKKIEERKVKYKKTEGELKMSIKSLAEAMRNVQAEYLLKQEGVSKDIGSLNAETKTLRGVLDELNIEIDVAKKNLEVQRGVIAEERKSYNAEIAAFKESQKALESEKNIFLTEKNIFLDLEGRLKKELDEEKGKINKIRSSLDDKIANAEITQKTYKEKSDLLESERLELRSWRERLEKKEELILQREENLNTNWTIFERERGKNKN